MRLVVVMAIHGPASRKQGGLAATLALLGRKKRYYVCQNGAKFGRAVGAPALSVNSAECDIRVG